MSKLVIQYASNLFVHKNQSWKQAKGLLQTGVAPHLALLGNIGIPQNPKTKDFLRWCSDNWSTVFCVPGIVELQEKENLYNLFSNIPNNIYLVDQTEIALPNNFYILGAPLWSNYAQQISGVTNWSEEEKYMMANKLPGHIRYWHEEDIEFFVERLRCHQSVYGNLDKLIIMTHHLPHWKMISNLSCARQVFLYDGSISHLFTESVVGCLSGAGGGSVTGHLGEYKTFCGVNAAFLGPSMIPNPQYRPDMTMSFKLNDPYTPDGKRAFVKWADFLPKPELGIATSNANSILF